LDHAAQKSADLSRIEILVLDEADRMLDMGFIHDIRKVLALLPPKRQNLLFSATFSDDIRRLAERLLHDPASVEVAARNTAAERVSQVVYRVDKARKRDLLAHLVHAGGWSQVLVFTRTKHGANRLAEQLQRDGISTAAIHGNKSQSARTKALSDFKQGAVRVLVATDIAARGLDIDQLPHVVNFELPNVPEDYVHRIGRTGRAGADGAAISLVSADERKQLTDIQRLLKREIPTASMAGFEPDPRAATVAEAPVSRPPKSSRPSGDRSSNKRHPHAAKVADAPASRSPRSSRPSGDRPSNRRRTGQGRPAR
jgi:ATP-dependent RNA helicase RhlE